MPGRRAGQSNNPRRSRHWGYHRLAEPWARRLVADAGIGRRDLVLDVGAGTGALTGPLVDVGAHVVAFELHAHRARLLRERFAGAAVTVVRADVRDLRLPRRPFDVVVNPPFAATAALLRRLVAPGSRLRSAHVIVPHHVARRWAEGRVAGYRRWGRVFDASVARRLPAAAFRPSHQGAAVLALRRRV